MVVRFSLPREEKDVGANAEPQEDNTPPKPPGGLVSRRVEMYEAPQPKNQVSRTYRRPTDSFRVKTSTSEEHTAEEIRHDEPSYESPNPDEGRVLNEPRENEPRENEPKKTVTLKDFVGSTWVERGVDLYGEGKYEDALEAFAAALQLQRASVGDDHLCIALTLANMGATYLQLEKFDEATCVLEESLSIKQRVAPSMVLADTMNNLGNCANLSGDYVKSLFYYTEAVDDLEMKGGNSADIASALFNLGRLKVQQNRWEPALLDLEKACALGKEVFGPQHLFVSETMDLMGFIHLSTSDFDKAMVSFTNALAIHRRLHGPMHIEVANSLLNIGMVREGKGDLADAWEAYTIAHDLFTKLNAKKDLPSFVATRDSIEQVERTIAKQNQQKLIMKHKKARAAFKKRPKTAEV